MNFRPRRSRLSKGQWEIQRERFQLESDEPAPIDEHTTTLKDPIHKLVASLGLSLESTQHQLMERWESIAGTPLCRHIRPGPLTHGSLTVYVTNSVMLAELSRFQGKSLLANIQSALGSSVVKKLYFQIDPDTRPRR